LWKKRTEHTSNLIDGVAVEKVESFKFHGVHISNKLTWSRHGPNLFPLRRLKRFGMGPRIL
jgi:hypothetical protein